MTTTEHQVSNNGRVSADTFLHTELGQQAAGTAPAAPISVPDQPVVPDDAPVAVQSVEEPVIPTMGFPGLVYRFSKGKWVLPLTAKEVAANKQAADEAAAQKAAEAEAAAAQAAADAEAQRLAQEQADRDEYQGLLEDAVVAENQQQTHTTMVSNVKGGAGKTPVACNLSTVEAATTGRVTTVLDNNPNWGTTAILLGINPEETVSVRQANDALQTFQADEAEEDGGIAPRSPHQEMDFASFSSPLGSNRFGVQLIASDEISRRDTYGYNVARRVIRAGQRNSIFVTVDTGNEISDLAMKATLELSDVLIITTLTTRTRLLGAVHTMDNYRNWGYTDLVNNAIIVVNGIEPGHSAEEYREVLGVTENQTLIGIPFDQRIHDEEAVDLRIMPQATYIAYLELSLAVVKVKKRIEATRKREGVTPLRLKQGEMVRLPSGRTPVLPYVTPNQSARS